MSSHPNRWRRGAASVAGGGATVYVLLVVILVVIVAINPSFAEPPALMAYAKTLAPLALLAIGEYFVVVSGEFDLSVGSLVGFQVVLAALLIDGDEARTLPVIGLLLVIGAVVGLVNGLITTVLKVPSIITTLGTMLVLFGAIRLLTGGAPTGSLSEAFRMAGRGGIELPVVRQLPWALLIAVVVAVGAAILMRRPYGRRLLAVGDNDRAAGFAGVRVAATRCIAFTLSGLLATVAAVLIGGFAGVTAKVGQDLEFTAITAVVIGGVVLGGGRGSVAAAMTGAVTVESLFTLFNHLSLPSSVRPTAQGLILIAAVAYAARDRFRRPRPTPTSQRHSDVATT